MRNKTKRLTLTALFTALTVVMLYIASIFPPGELGLIAAASLFAIAAVTEGGIGAGVIVYVASSLLGLIILPNKTIMILHIMFLGCYPVIKSLIERLHNLFLEWLIKIAVFNLALSAVRFLFEAVIAGPSVIQDSIPIFYLAGNTAFVIFDIGVSRLIAFYLDRISKSVKR